MAKIEVAEPKDRFAAAAIDFVPPFMLFLIASPFSSGWAALLAIGGSVYLIFRDLIGNGQSIGKKLTNLHVVDSETDRVPEPMALIVRNLGFGVPGLNVVYAIVEGIQVLRQPQGLRYGDMFAQTGVVRVPADEREKLLAPKADRSADRPSRSNPRIQNPDHDPDAATQPEGQAAPVGSAPKRPPAGTPIDLPADKPSVKPPAKPAAPKG